MELLSLEKELKGNSYPGRGIIIGRSADGTKAVTAYFIMGRSENSRNRVFVEDGEGIRTQAFDPSKLTDPSLIIYAPVRVLGNKTIVTNGDQTDTIYEGMDKQLTFEQSLRSREFEPDGPNYTPRISGILHVEGGKYSYAMSILRVTMEIQKAAAAIRLLMKMPWQERAASFTPTNVMEIRCQALRENPNWYLFPMTWKRLQPCCGTA